MTGLRIHGPNVQCCPWFEHRLSCKRSPHSADISRLPPLQDDEIEILRFERPRWHDGGPHAAARLCEAAEVTVDFLIQLFELSFPHVRGHTLHKDIFAWCPAPHVFLSPPACPRHKFRQIIRCQRFAVSHMVRTRNCQANGLHTMPTFRLCRPPNC